ncbi:hypothetical protein GQX73_g4094 [Xylaria multiplex]|uniref:NACHT-NTPase and P-loop NTPases N-terminal domain-containing protein n=1 Tax=Xylaria multiplex TaxID=323545 RepID=A0A7C8ISY5_9PEZI|nr:hypothetical protein GQX73_g4094 [Xylaria multiplex]
MDVIGSAAAISQLLSQAIGLWQQVQTAYECVKTRPKLLMDMNAQLSNILPLIDGIEREPTLCTGEIYGQLDFIKRIATELCQKLQAMAALQRKSPVRQSIHAWSRGSRDEAKLADILQRLQQAKTELAIHINLVHLSLTSNMTKGMDRSSKIPDIETQIPPRDTKERQRLTIEGNATGEAAQQLNGIIAMDASRDYITASIRNNQVLQQGRQKNIISGATADFDLLRIAD